MAFGEVNDVDVVADTGAVDGVVVVAVDADEFASADGDLGDVGEEVVWCAAWVFADEAAWVGADWVEVAQDCYVPVVVRDAVVTQDLFDHKLCLPVRVSNANANTTGFGEWKCFRVTVNGRRRTENERLGAVCFHCF